MESKIVTVNDIDENVLHNKIIAVINELSSKAEPVVYTMPVMPEKFKRTLPFSNCKVNLYYMTCTCKEYRQKAGKYPRKDIRRICKHLFNALLSNYSELLDELTVMLLENKFWFNIEEIFKTDNQTYIGIGKEWIVITTYETGLKRYAYNFIEKYWSEEPVDLYPVLKILENLT